MVPDRLTSRRPAQRPLLILKLVLLACGLWLTSHWVLTRLGVFVKVEVYHWLLAVLFIWAAAVAALLYIAYCPRAAERIGWALLVGLSTLVGDIYFQVAGSRMTLWALDAMWVPELFSPDMVAFYRREVGAALLGTSVLLAGLLLPPYLPVVPRWRALALLPLAPILLISAVIVYDAASNGIETKVLPGQFHTLSLAALYVLDRPPSEARAEVDIPRIQPAAARHIVLIVDESVSGDFIDLNKARGTTPYLATRPADLVNFGLATSASNCSNASNAIMRLGARPESLGNGSYSLFANPSIWKYAREAGYETTFLDAQRLAESRQNFMFREEIALIGHVEVVPATVTAERKDDEVLRSLLGILARPDPQFVYVNKYGTHFPYRRMTPDGPRRFEPAMEPMEAIGDRERLVRSYMNAIDHAVDGFFRELLARTDLADTVLIYTSDHGQNLLDDGRPATHCRHMDRNPYEALVPLIVWAGDEALRARFRQGALMNFNKASHFEIFPTLLDLLGYDPAIVRQRYHLSLFERIDQPLGFVTGPVTGRFGRGPAWSARADLQRLER